MLSFPAAPSTFRPTQGTASSEASPPEFVELVETNPRRPRTRPSAYHLSGEFGAARPRHLTVAVCFFGLVCLLTGPVAAEQVALANVPDAVTKHLLSTMQGCGANLGAPAAAPECSGDTIERHIAIARLARWLMGPFWDGLGSEKQNDFERLLAQLFRALVYQRASEFLATTRFEYGATQTQGNEALVAVAVVNAEEERVALSFRLNRAGGDWKVWDVWLDGVSLANNIRKQVQSVMAKHSYDELVKRMRQKIDAASID